LTPKLRVGIIWARKPIKSHAEVVACETRHMKTDGNKQSNRLSGDIEHAFLKLAGDVLTSCKSYWIVVYRYTNEFMLP
jgi:hypothetical protein